MSYSWYPCVFGCFGVSRQRLAPHVEQTGTLNKKMHKHTHTLWSNITMKFKHSKQDTSYEQCCMVRYCKSALTTWCYFNVGLNWTTWLPLAFHSCWNVAARNWIFVLVLSCTTWYIVIHALCAFAAIIVMVIVSVDREYIAVRAVAAHFLLITLAALRRTCLPRSSLQLL